MRGAVVVAKRLTGDRSTGFRWLEPTELMTDLNGEYQLTLGRGDISDSTLRLMLVATHPDFVPSQQSALGMTGILKKWKADRGQSLKPIELREGVPINGYVKAPHGTPVATQFSANAATMTDLVFIVVFRVFVIPF